MASDSFLRLKGRTSYFRRKIPAPLQTQLASSEICFRLGVIDRDSAVLLARRLAVDVDAFFVSARENKMLSSNDLNAVLTAGLRHWEAGIQAVPDASMPGRRRAKDLATMAETVLDRQRDGFDIIDDDFVRDALVAADVVTELDQTGIRIVRDLLGSGMAAHFLETAAQLARQVGSDRGFFKLPVLEWEEKAARILAPYSVKAPETTTVYGSLEAEVHSASSLQEVSPTAVSTIRSKGKTPGPESTRFERDAGPTFSTQAKYLVRERIKAKMVGAGALGNVEPSLRIWDQICGDLDIREYTVDHMVEFRSVLLDLPQIYWRTEKEREKPLRQIIAEAAAKGPGYARISPTTINKHLSGINSIFEYAKKIHVLPRSSPNFGEGLHLDTEDNLEAHEQRPGFTEDQVRLFFTHPVFMGRKSAYFYNHAGPVIVRDTLFWLPILAALQLVRREEICQLKVKHVRQLEGIWFFDLMQKDLKLKNAQSKRRIPIHDYALRLGFIEQVVAGRDPEELLFPDLAPNAQGSFSDAVGKRVSRMVDSLDIKLIRVDQTEANGAFHPFRHYGITQLENSAVKSSLIEALSGHSSEARKSERRRYTDEYYLHVLKEAIDTLVVPIDVDELNRRWELRNVPK